jgi:hypothetical protein
MDIYIKWIPHSLSYYLSYQMVSLRVSSVKKKKKVPECPYGFKWDEKREDAENTHAHLVEPRVQEASTASRTAISIDSSGFPI